MLFKYVGNDNDDKVIEYLGCFVEKGTMYASRPLDFNDPAELKIKFNFKADINVIRRKFFEDKPGLSEKDFLNWYEAFDEHYQWYVAYSAREQFLTRNGIVCLTRDCNNFLMWSHYACSHTGFCIGFDERLVKDIGDQALCGDVKYVKTYPCFNYFKEPITNYVKAVFFHKGSPWGYEKEFRIITDTFGPKLFDKELIREVTLGCRASKKLQDYACTLIDKGIKVYKMALSENTYQLRKILLKKGHYFQGDA
ncbi:DUF2971 domain-containing protein [Citrobacter amalonaticus]|nr:DUF2971 domain-containing protein [Citrobacter amalonaticus]